MSTLKTLILTYKGVAIMVGKEQNNYGHAWLADGSMHIRYTIITYNNVSIIGSEDSDTSTTYEDYYYVHLNWGWGGHCNGYFIFDLFDTSKAKMYDYPTLDNSSNTYYFNRSLNYYFIR
jgi:hypothetical protein